MASSSSSSSTTPKLKCKVFLSFRGEDTRGSFTSHLYEALCQQKIATFIDDELIRGDQISHSLSNAIDQSEISVVIFSEHYASSRWCLNELEKILECNDHIVIPVFYHVDPSDVRNQTGTVGEAFSQLEERFKDDSEKLERWRTALRDAADLSGFDSQNYRHESSLVKDIVKDILNKLNDECLEIDNENLVGLDSTIEVIENLLCTKGVSRLGIWGIGGIGKTTLARALIRKIYKQFEAHYFIQNIREESEKSGGLNDLRQRLRSAVLGDKHPNFGFTLKRKRLRRALIVFDDVTKVKQMEELMEEFGYLDSDCQIIITARDEHVLKECGVDHIHEMEGLFGDDAFHLFNGYAFRGNSLAEDYIELSSRAVAYAKGLPLALKVLGSSLFGRTKKDWKSILENLKRTPHMDIFNILKVSYDGLDSEQKEVFLDIACFFKGCKRALIEEVLDANGFNSHIYINVLIERSLITTSFNTITMHDLLQDMGRQIVREESANNPGKRSRLWDHEEIYSVLKNNTGTGAIRSISLDVSKAREIHLKPKAFNKMHNLRFLEVYGFACGTKVHGFEDLESDFSELRYLSWLNYSAKSLPRNFNPENLVALSLARCSIQKLPSSLLLQLPAYHKRKRLNLEDCFIEVLPNNLSDFRSLRFLYLGRNNFESLPECIKDLSKLYKLDVSNCQRLKSLPELPDKLLHIEAKGCTSLEALSGLPTQCLSMGTDEEEISFINCCNLKLDLTDALRNIERNADVWFSSEENTTWLSRGNLPKAFICYPGSEIPDWFDFPSQSGYIELPSDWLTDDLIGFSFCAVASFRDYEEAEALQVRCFLVVNEEIVSTGCLFNNYGHEVIDTDDVIEADHVFLGYNYDIMALELLTHSSNSKGYMEFFVVHGSKNSRRKTKLKKCGVRLLYAKDNYTRTDGRVEREQRFPNIYGCLRCHLHCCVKHEDMDENIPFETLESWSPHSGIYEPPIRREYLNYIQCKWVAQAERKRMDWAKCK